MRVRFFGLSLVLMSSAAFAQAPGVALNAGRGLDNGMGVNWTFKENWTLRPTVGAGYSQQAGFQARIGSTILRSVGAGHRVYAYIGAGAYFTTGNSRTSTLGGVNQTGGVVGQSNVSASANSFDRYYQPQAFFVTAPLGVRARLYRNFEAFAEAAYQKTLTGQFAQSQTGQFSGDQYARFGATFGISMRLN